MGKRLVMGPDLGPDDAGTINLDLSFVGGPGVTTGVAREKRLRSIPMTGVMPEPAVTNSSLLPPAARSRGLVRAH